MSLGPLPWALTIILLLKGFPLSFEGRKEHLKHIVHFFIAVTVLTLVYPGANAQVSMVSSENPASV